jgi:hypothetical protein
MLITMGDSMIFIKLMQGNSSLMDSRMSKAIAQETKEENTSKKPHSIMLNEISTKR